MLIMDSDDILARYLCGNQSSSSESHIYLNEFEQFSNSSLNILNTEQETHSIQSSFCTKDNIESAVNFLSKELNLLGYPSLEQNGIKNLSIVNLINATYELLQLHKSNIKFQEELENRNSRTNSDIDYLHLNQVRLKNTLTQTEKNLASLQERERQLTDQNRSLQQKLKNEKEEIKKLNGLQHQREVQYQHEIRKRERETTKLKERLNQLLADRSQSRCVGIEILNNLPRKDGSRSKWKTNHLENKQEEEMYKSLIKDYESRHRMIVEENIILRHLLFQANEELTTVLQQIKSKDLKQLKSSRTINTPSSDDAIEVDDFSLTNLDDLTEGHFNMPIETLQNLMRTNLTKKFHFINSYITKDEGHICDTVNPEHDTKYTDLITKQNDLLEKAVKLFANDVSSSDKKNFQNEKIAITKEWEQLVKSHNETSEKKSLRTVDIDSTTEPT